MEEEYTCKDCWQFEEPDYTEMHGRCVIHKKWRPFHNSAICDDFDNRHYEEPDWEG